MYPIKDWGRTCGHHVQGEPQTQEKCTCEEWSKSAIPTSSESLI